MFLSWKKITWGQVGPKSALGAPRSLSQTLLGGSWGPPGVVQRPRGVPGGLGGAKMASRSLQNEPKLTPQSSKFDPKSITNMTSGSFQKHLKLTANWLLSGYFLVAFCLLSACFLFAFWLLSGCFLAAFWLLTGGCLFAVWVLSGCFLAAFWLLWLLQTAPKMIQN